MQNKRLQDHFENPRNVGILDSPSAIGITENPVCGDRIQLMLKVDNEKILEAKFKTFGCPAAIACSSVVTELVLQKTIIEAKQVNSEIVAQELGGLPSVQYHCANLASDALQQAISSLNRN